MTEPSLPGGRYYKVSEVCRAADVLPYVLRYWETEFPQLAQERSAPGPRLYSERDLRIIVAIKKLLYAEGYTIAAAKKRLEIDLKRDGLLDVDDEVAAPPESLEQEPVDVSEVSISDAPAGVEGVRSSEGKATKGSKSSKSLELIPGNEDDSSKLAAMESLRGEGEVDRTPMEVVKPTSPRMALAVAELKEILEILSKPAQ